MRYIILSLAVVLSISCAGEALSQKRSFFAFSSETLAAAQRGDARWFSSRGLDASVLSIGLSTAATNAFVSYAYDPEVDGVHGNAIIASPQGGYWVLAFSYDENARRWNIARIDSPRR